MKEAELSDGTILEFPEETPDAIIEQRVKEMTHSQQAQSPQSPFSGLGEFFSSGGSAGDVAKGIGNELLAESPVLAGATGGAILGGSAGGPPGAIAGALGGGTLGAVSKEAVEQIGLRTGLLDEGQKLISEEPLKKKSFEQSALDAGMKGIELGVGEGVGQAIIRPFSKLSTGFSKSVTPEGRETLDFFKGTGVTPNPAKVTDARILDIASNAGEASIVGGERFLQGQARAKEYIDGVIANMMDSVGQSKETLGQLFSDAVSSSMNSFRGTSKVLFDKVSNSIGDSFVNTSSIRKQVGQLRNELSGIQSDPVLLKRLGEAGDTSVGGAGLQQTGMRFSEAQALRSDLLAVIRGSKDNIPDKTIGRIKQLTSNLEREMEAVAKGSGDNALSQWRRANKFWKEGNSTFNDKVIKNIMQKDPDAAVSALFNAGKDKPVMIKRIKRALGDRALINDFENSTIKTLIFKSTNELGEVVPQKLLNNLKAFGGTDGAALKAMFPKGQDKVLQRLGRIKEVVIKAQPDATGRFAVQIGQIAALTGLATGNFEETSTFILLAPFAISRAFTNPRIVKFLTDGAKSRPALKQGATFTTRLASLLGAEGVPFEIQAPDLQSAQTPFSGLAERFAQ